MSHSSSPSGRGLRIGFLEPHLRCFGGVRRMLEFANRLTARGHQVVFYLPESEVRGCDWMRCDAEIMPISAGRDHALDVIVFNQEPQWFLLDRFPHARRRVFYALHFARLYAKEGSWESLSAEVDLQLANSAWTADRIAEVTGLRPLVQLGGVNREMFHPRSVRRRRPVLCTGDRKRAWKGTDTIIDAGRIARVRVESYAGRGLDQEALGRMYSQSRVFAVGSWFEGFCQPGLEALASGTPLVTTDNGGCREYARDGETALVVAPKDAVAMAKAFRRLLDDPTLSSSLAANGLDLVAEQFDWERRTDEFEAVLDGLVASNSAPPPVPRRAPERPEVTVAVIAGSDLVATQRVVDSIRWETDIPFELIVTDPGGDPTVTEYAAAAADRVIDGSGGRARARNLVLDQSHAAYVAFCEPGASLPAGWLGHLLDAAGRSPDCAIVRPRIVPAHEVGAVEPGAVVRIPALAPVGPGRVVLVSPAALGGLGGWDERLRAEASDLDLTLRAWVAGYGVVADDRVVVGYRDQRPLAEWAEPEIGPGDRKALLAKWRDRSLSSVSVGPEPDAELVDAARSALLRLDLESVRREQRIERDRRLFGIEGPLRSALRASSSRLWRLVQPRLPAAFGERVAGLRRRRSRASI